MDLLKKLLCSPIFPSFNPYAHFHRCPCVTQPRELHAARERDPPPMRGLPTVLVSGLGRFPAATGVGQLRWAKQKRHAEHLCVALVGWMKRRLKQATGFVARRGVAIPTIFQDTY